MKKMREINYIFYMTLLYMFSSLYIVLKKGPIYKLFDIEKLIKYDSLISIVTGLGIIFLLVNYYRNTNQVLKTIIFKVILPIGVILLGLNYPNFGLDGIIYAMGIYLIVTYIFMYPIIFCKNRIDGDDNNLKLYPSRKTQEDILTYALENYNLIALDGTWGSGKTTFMNIAMRDNMEKYYYIPINVMLFENRNSLKTEFLNQLKVIFKEEGIFQGSLMDFDYYLDGVSNDWIKVVKNIIFSKSKSFKEANEKLKSEIGKIEKRIVVGVDNLERIYGEPESEWKQILGFINELQELGIKIVVMANLEEMLTTKKETGEKDLSSHEYFDKFYEFKLQLNEVTTEEIIDELEIKKDELRKNENTVDREWLKEQIKELTKTLEIGKEVLNDDAEEKKDIKILYKELQNRYLKNIVNPRKIEKLIWNIKNKKENINNIYNFIDDGDEYDKLIFKASMFSMFYFDFMDEIKNKEFDGFTKEKKFKIENFFGYFFKNIGESHRGLKRILFYDTKEDLIIKEMKKLISTKEINLSTIDKRLKDLDVYSGSLDPDFDQKITKEAYKMIEKKLIELEKTDENKIHKIIKENEGNICRLNYITYPYELGIFKDIKYKFDNETIYMMYRELEDILVPRRSKSPNKLRDMLETINVYYYFEKENYFKTREMSSDVNLNKINELLGKINQKKDILKARKEKEVSSIYKDENLKYDMVLNFLMIIKYNMEKEEIAVVEELKLENWGKYAFKAKEKLLNVLENNFENIKEVSRENSNFTLFTEVKEESDLLKSIIEKEENKTIILKLADLIKTIEYRLVEFEILKKVNDINIEVDNDKKINLREELLNFIKEKLKEERLQYMFNRQYWGGWMDVVEEIGIKEEAWTIKPQGEMEEEEE